MRREMRNRDAIPEVPLVHRCPTNSRPHMPATKVKEEAQRLIEKLPDDATWDDLMRRIYVRQAIEAGLEDSDAGRTMDVNELRKRLGLSE